MFNIYRCNRTVTTPYPLRCQSQRRVRQGPFLVQTWQGGEIEPYALQGTVECALLEEISYLRGSCGVLSIDVFLKYNGLESIY
jgi:hypothetical protein